MLKWLTRTARTRTTTPTCRKPRLALEWLEQREVPALTIQFDYSFDSAGFFNDPSRRAILQQAANDVASHITTSLNAIAPSGGNYWTATFYNPATGQQAQVGNLTVASDTLVIYAGGRSLGGGE